MRLKIYIQRIRKRIPDAQLLQIKTIIIEEIERRLLNDNQSESKKRI